MGTDVHGVAVETTGGNRAGDDLLIENLSELPTAELTARFCGTCMCWSAAGSEV